MPPTPNLTPFEWFVLGKPCSVNPYTLDELWNSVQEYERASPYKMASSKPSLETALVRLRAIGLVRSLPALEGAPPLWLRTSEGDLAVNWHMQREGPDCPEPRPGETGNRIAPEPCDQFRAFHASPGYCWCGWIRAKHSPDAQQSKGAALP